MADIVNMGVEIEAKGALNELKKLDTGLDKVGNSAEKNLGKLDKHANKTGKSVTSMGSKAKAARSGISAMGGSLLNVADGAGLMEGKFGRLINRTRSLIGGVTGLGRTMSGLTGAAGGAAGSVGALGGAAGTAGGGVAALGAGTVATGGALLVLLGVVAAVTAALIAMAAAATVAIAAAAGLFSAWSKGSPIAASLEDARLQLAFMMGDMGKAEKRMTDLVNFSNETPFSPTEVIEADKLLYSAGKEDLANNENLKLIGAAAKIANKPLIEVTSTFSRLYASLKLGKPDGEALRRLMIEIPVLSQSAGVQLKALSAAGADQATMWKVVTDDLRKYENMLLASSQTFNGMISTVKGKWDFLLAEFAKPINNALKPLLLDLQNAIDFLLPYAQRLGKAIADGIKALYQIAKEEGIAGLIEYTALGLEVAAERFGYFMTTYGVAAADTLIQHLGPALVTTAFKFGNALIDAVLKPIKLMAKAAAAFVDAMTNPTGVTNLLGAIIKGANRLKYKIVHDAISKTTIAEDFNRNLKERQRQAGPIEETDASRRFDEQTKLLLERWESQNKWTENVAGIPNLPGGPEAPSPVDTAAKAGAGKGNEPVEEQIGQTEQLLRNWGDIEKQIDGLAAGALQSLSDTLVDVISGTKDAKEAFRAMAAAIVKEILRIIVQLLIELAIRQAIAALTGGASTAAGAAGGAAKAATAHTGGRVGGTSTRGVPAATFMGAPRYHIGGLASSEMPAILEKGEQVLSRKQKRDVEMSLDDNNQNRSNNQKQPEIKIVNVIDPKEVQREISDNPNLIMNVVSRNRKAFQRILQS